MDVDSIVVATNVNFNIFKLISILRVLDLRKVFFQKMFVYFFM